MRKAKRFVEWESFGNLFGYMFSYSRVVSLFPVLYNCLCICLGFDFLNCKLLVYGMVGKCDLHDDKDQVQMNTLLIGKRGRVRLTLGIWRNEKGKRYQKLESIGDCLDDLFGIE